MCEKNSRNQNIRKLLKQISLIRKIKNNNYVEWYGHTIRMKDDRF